MFKLEIDSLFAPLTVLLQLENRSRNTLSICFLDCRPVNFLWDLLLQVVFVERARRIVRFVSVSIIIDVFFFLLHLYFFVCFWDIVYLLVDLILFCYISSIIHLSLPFTGVRADRVGTNLLIWLLYIIIFLLVS